MVAKEEEEEKEQARKEEKDSLPDWARVLRRILERGCDA
jgi:tRNA1(Val) A37 N6-methylase TrmN6